MGWFKKKKKQQAPETTDLPTYILDNYRRAADKRREELQKESVWNSQKQ